LTAATPWPVEKVVDRLSGLGIRQGRVYAPQTTDGLDELGGLGIERDHPLIVKFAERDMKGPVLVVELLETIELQVHELADPHSRGTQKKEPQGDQVADCREVVFERGVGFRRERLREIPRLRRDIASLNERPRWSFLPTPCGQVRKESSYL
jgi:hypothetical protein